MLDLRFIREHAAEVKLNVNRRQVKIDIDELLRLEHERLVLLQATEELRRERNLIAEQMKKAATAVRPALIEQGKALKEVLGKQEVTLIVREGAVKVLALQVPNMTHPDAPDGASDEDNKELEVIGTVPTLAFKPLTHVELAAKHDLIDFERGAKVAGAKFYFLKKQLAILEQALIFWTLQQMTAEGYTPMITPDLAKDAVLLGTGYNPRGPETQIYSVEGSDLSLIGTAEISLGGYHQDEIIDEDKLPLKYVGVSHCFRTEAGAYGRESYGLYRVHQFSKVELFLFCTPEQSNALHEELRRLEQMLFSKLGWVFRVVDICTGDLGGPAYRKYDLEAWMWGRNEGRGGWGEVTSASNCTDYQARRLNVKIRRHDGSLEYAHTLNGTGIAIPRALIAILEQYQQADGSIAVPEVLQALCGFERIGEQVRA